MVRMESITEQLDNEMDTKIDLKNLEVEEVIMTNYTNCIPLATAKWLDLFDDVPYKYLKELLEEEEDYDFIVEIEDMPCDRVAWCKTSFTFTIEYKIYDIINNSKKREKEFTVIKEYNGSSLMALTIIGLQYPDEEEEESDEWCECCWCGKELTNEKGVMYQDECVCLECHTRTKKMMEIGKERLEEIKNKKESEEEKYWTVGDIDIEGYKNYMKREHEQMKRQQELKQEKNESESEEEELEFE